MPETYTDAELIYAATAKCQCGAGLAYPLDPAAAMKLRAWVCSRVLRGDQGPSYEGQHDRLDFATFKIREETSVNNGGRYTTRPPGTAARTVGRATCPKCKHEWESEPYDAAMAGRHWFGGTCPECGYAVGADGHYRSSDGPAIEHRYRDIVLTEPTLKERAEEASWGLVAATLADARRCLDGILRDGSGATVSTAASPVAAAAATGHILAAVERIVDLLVVRPSYERRISDLENVVAARVVGDGLRSTADVAGSAARLSLRASLPHKDT